MDKSIHLEIMSGLNQEQLEAEKEVENDYRVLVLQLS